MKELNKTATSVIIKHQQNILNVYTIKADIKELSTTVCDKYDYQTLWKHNLLVHNKGGHEGIKYNCD